MKLQQRRKCRPLTSAAAQILLAEANILHAYAEKTAATYRQLDIQLRIAEANTSFAKAEATVMIAKAEEDAMVNKPELHKSQCPDCQEQARLRQV